MYVLYVLLPMEYSEEMMLRVRER
jgi:hypothetical protein